MKSQITQEHFWKRPPLHPHGSALGKPSKLMSYIRTLSLLLGLRKLLLMRIGILMLFFYFFLSETTSTCMGTCTATYDQYFVHIYLMDVGSLLKKIWGWEIWACFWWITIRFSSSIDNLTQTMTPWFKYVCCMYTTGVNSNYTSRWV